MTSDDQGRARRNDTDSLPHPDPTRLTTEQLTRAILDLKELFNMQLTSVLKDIEIINQVVIRRPAEVDKQIDHLRGFLEARIDGMDRANVLLQQILDRTPLIVDEKIEALGRLHEEKFLSIAGQFRERDVRTEQSSKDSKVAVDAALQAAKEAVGEQNKSSALAIAKSEASTVKQIDQLGLLIATQATGFNDKVADLKDRITLMVGHGGGIKDSWGWLVAAIGIGVAIFEAFAKH